MTSSKQLVRGIFNGAFAGACWGIVFIAPVILVGASPLLITLARFGWYGIVSVFALLFHRKIFYQLKRHDYFLALFFAFAGYVGYYFALVKSIQAVGPVVPTLIIGTLPITLAIVGNFRQREISFRNLFGPLTLILIGLALVNIHLLKESNLVTSENHAEMFAGILWALSALALWTSYGVLNGEFLKKRLEISSSDWSSMCGAATLISVFCVLPFSGSIATSVSLSNFICLTAIMGIVSSWVATYFWNNASAALPTGLTGQLVVFETIFGLISSFFYESRFPTLLENVGIFLLLTGVLCGVKALRKKRE